MSVCQKCHHMHVVRDASALSRFAGVAGFRTADGEIHATREDAQEWLCDQRQAKTTTDRTEPQPQRVAGDDEGMSQ